MTIDDQSLKISILGHDAGPHRPCPPSSGASRASSGGTPPSRTREEARPYAQRPVNLEDYDHFKYQYKQYNARLGDNTDNPSRLLECLAEDVSKMLFSSLGPEMTNLAEAELFDNISASCVTKQTVQARMAELHRIKQDPGQPVQSFLANLKSKSR